MKTFLKILIVSVLLIASFVVGSIFGNKVTNWFDKTFISRDSKILGEWEVESVELIKGEESAKVTAEEFEEYLLNYDSSKATELEKELHSMAEGFLNTTYDFKKNNFLEVYKINSDGEKEVTEEFSWTFKKGIIEVKNEENLFSCEYNKKGTIADTKLNNGIILRQVMVRK